MHRDFDPRNDLERIATDSMLARGLAPEFPAAVLAQLSSLHGGGQESSCGIDNLSALPWCSIDHDDSGDFGPLICCEPLPGGATRLRVAMADVDALVKPGSAIDEHARFNATTVRTAARTFTMLPERLCAELTALRPGRTRLALATDIVISEDGSMIQADVRRAWVRSQEHVAGEAVAAWLDGEGAAPTQSRALLQQLRLQDALAQRLRAHRRALGALQFERLLPRAVYEGGALVEIRQPAHHRAHRLIEEAMIATSRCLARFMSERGAMSLRRVLRSPERWHRIVEFARAYSHMLPPRPDARALEGFLAQRRRADPVRFPHLSSIVVELMGAGEYVVEQPGAATAGHFGVAVQAYTHATAPHRRYSDLITARLIKARLAGAPAPYGHAELTALAAHCSGQEDAARKVERKLRKCEAAQWLRSRPGQPFDAMVTGHSGGNTWVRVSSPPLEGRLGWPMGAGGSGRALALGERLRVKAVSADAERGFVDFEGLR